MDSIAPGPENQQKPGPIPSLRQRFVTRATWLKTYAPFVQRLDRCRRGWNARYRQFPLQPRSAPPARYVPSAHDMPFRRDLDDTVDPADGYDRVAYVVELQADIEDDWQRLVLGVCRQWFPAALFPNWTGLAFAHPAEAFIAGCLLWNVDGVPTDWIRSDGPWVVWLDHDPTERAAGADLAYECAYLQRIERNVRRLVHEAKLTSEQAAAVFAGAHAAGAQTWAATDARNAAKPPYGFLPITAGLNRKRWRELEPEIQTEIAQRIAGLDQLARRRFLRGDSRVRIARDFGISRRAAQRLVPPALRTVRYCANPHIPG